MPRLRLSILATLVLAASTVAAAQWPTAEVPRESFDVDTLASLDLSKLKDGVIREYGGSLASVREVRAFRDALPALRKRAIDVQRTYLGLPASFEPLMLTVIVDGALTGGDAVDNMSTNSRKVGDRHISVISVPARSLVSRKCVVEETYIHEASHALLREYLGDSYAAVPQWLREGLAVLSAGQRDRRLRALLAGAFWTSKDSVERASGIVERLTDGFGASGDFDDYGEFALAVEFLTARVENAVPRLVASLKSGIGPWAAIESLTQLTEREFLAAARDHARRVFYEMEGGKHVDAVLALRAMEAAVEAVKLGGGEKERAAAHAAIAGVRALLRGEATAPGGYVRSAAALASARAMRAVGDHAGAVKLLGGMLASGGDLVESMLTMMALRELASAALEAREFDVAEDAAQRLKWGFDYHQSSVELGEKILADVAAHRERAADPASK